MALARMMRCNGLRIHLGCAVHHDAIFNDAYTIVTLLPHLKCNLERPFRIPRAVGPELGHLIIP